MNVETIDALLPQTQCGLCSYAGCRPYAEAIAHQHERLDRCPPGGTKTLRALGALLEQDVTALIPGMQQIEKPPQTAYIRPEECIGCTKCIQACPVDAITGSAKQLHTILTEECTGCGLCVAPCPVDCIDLSTVAAPLYQPDQARQRYQARNTRLAQKKSIDANKQQQDLQTQTLASRKAYIADAIARVKLKKNLR